MHNLETSKELGMSHCKDNLHVVVARHKKIVFFFYLGLCG